MCQMKKRKENKMYIESRKKHLQKMIMEEELREEPDTSYIKYLENELEKIS